MFDLDDLQTLYDALGDAVGVLQATLEEASELGLDDPEAIAEWTAKLAAYVALRVKIHPRIFA